MTTVLGVIVLVCGVFWVGVYLGKGYRLSRRSLTYTLPLNVRLFRAVGPPRRTERVALTVPILVTGLDVSGEEFDESTHTMTISGYGASIVLNRQLKPGQQVLIRRIDKSREASVRVLHELTRSQEGHLYGVAFVDPASDLWGACKLLTEAKRETLEEPSSQPSK